MRRNQQPMRNDAPIVYRGRLLHVWDVICGFFFVQITLLIARMLIAVYWICDHLGGKDDESR